MTWMTDEEFLNKATWRNPNFELDTWFAIVMLAFFVSLGAVIIGGMLMFPGEACS